MGAQWTTWAMSCPDINISFFLSLLDFLSIFLHSPIFQSQILKATSRAVVIMLPLSTFLMARRQREPAHGVMPMSKV
jgi:hypothetical protein